MVRYNLGNLSFTTNEYKNMANELYRDNGFTIIRDFIPKEDLNTIINKYANLDYEKQNEKIKISKQHDPSNYHNFLMTYMYKNKKSNYDELVFKYVNQAFDIRNKVGLQQESDLYILDYCQRYNICPEDLETLREHQLQHSFVRIAWYRHGEGQIPHYDNPGEIQAIIFLTQKGIDYKDGGLVIINEEQEIDADSIICAGDLVLFNSYKKYHKVAPVVCEVGQIGRMHIFIPMIRDYWFPKTYFFKEEPNKLYFSLPLSEEEQEKLYIKHLVELNNGSAKPIDLNKD